MQLSSPLKSLHADLVYLLLALLLASLPHYSRLSLWLLILCPLIFLIRILLQGIQQKLLSSFTSYLLHIVCMLTGLFCVWFYHGSLFGQEASTSMLLLLAMLKVFEIKASRDFYVACFLAYFLVITNFLYSQSILMVLMMGGALLVTTATLIAHNDSGRSLSKYRPLYFAAILLLQSLPIMVLLFLFLPRIPGPLWSMPETEKVGTTGISERMSPGSISRLLTSNAVAFRVKFYDPLPELSKLYWRGPVLLFTDGKTWSGRKYQHFTDTSAIFFGQPVNYQMTMEASGQAWLFPLEIPGTWPAGARLDSNLQLKSAQVINKRQRFDYNAYTDFKLDADKNKQDFSSALQLPQGAHPKARKLAASWQTSGMSQPEIVTAALNWFKSNNFYYTFTPSLLTTDTVDEFLFDSRNGFCEHYAAAFVILMRAAGIPARVVTGYLGGEFNSVGDYLIVRQRDAHAWTEVWLEKRGWVRIDPVAIVAPQRIENGVSRTFPDEVDPLPAWMVDNLPLRDFWFAARKNWDALNFHWQQLIIDFDPKLQLKFFAWLGFSDIDWRGMAMLAFIILAGCVLLIAIYILRQIVKPRDPAVRYYQQFCQRLEKIGIMRIPSETPLHYARRAMQECPDLKTAIFAFTNGYLDYRYGHQHTSIKDLKLMLQALPR